MTHHPDHHAKSDFRQVIILRVCTPISPLLSVSTAIIVIIALVIHYTKMTTILPRLSMPIELWMCATEWTTTDWTGTDWDGTSECWTR